MSEKRNELVQQAQAIQAQGGQYPLEALERMAHYIVRSGLFGVKREEEAVALLLLAQAEGLHPMRAVQEYHIIQGRPALRADAMLARFLQAGGRVEWHELSNEAAEATFIHPQGGRVRIRWTLEDAKRAGLLDKAGDMWRKYPRAMLRARVVSEGVRTVYPGVVVGLYAPEEVVAFAEEERAPVPVQAEVVESTPPPSSPEGDNGHSSGGPIPENGADGTITPAQVRALKALLGKAGVDRDLALVYASVFVGRDLGSSKDLTREEASRLIDHLNHIYEVVGDDLPALMADAVERGEVLGELVSGG